MNIILSYKKHECKGIEIPSYPFCFKNQLESLGHKVTCVGHGQEYSNIFHVNQKKYDVFIDLDGGRTGEGKFNFQCETTKAQIPSAVWFIDTHGGGGHNATLHKRLASNYDHVFFAVWDRRDIFTNHPSSHWLPNATDDHWFDSSLQDPWGSKPYDVGFFGSKGGLDRADILKQVCTPRKLRYDIREIGAPFKPRWPRTAESMAKCKLLYNQGQKHDGPNQRVMEAMVMNIPLITNRDKRDGMDKLFKEGTHYLGFDSISTLGNQIDWCFEKENEPLLQSMAQRAYEEVKNKHLIYHRVKNILEVLLNGI